MKDNRLIKKHFKCVTSLGYAFHLFLALLFLITCEVTTSIAQELSVDLQVKKSVSEDPENFFLSGLISANVDDDLNIYLTDVMQNAVFKVDENGKYIDTIVENGRGPGEVSSIYSVMVDKSQGELIIADRRNARLSTLDLNGDELTSFTMHPGESNMPLGMAEFTNGNHLLLYPLSETQRLRAEEGIDSFFHVYNLETGRRIASFGDRGQILNSLSYTDGIAAAQTNTFIGSARLIKRNKMLYAPNVYGGTLLEYRLNEERTWKLFDKVSGTQLSRQATIDFDFEDYMENRQAYRDETPRNISESMGPGNNAAGIINYYSGGIYQTSDYVIHFYVSEDEIEESFRHTLYVELFDERLTFLGSHKIYEGVAGEIMGGGVTDMDREGNFYMPIRHFSQPERNRAIVFELDISE